MENRKFTNTAIPVFSGTEVWYQHIHIVQAIVKSNGWPEETAALQLFVHLKGEALNVALLLAKKERESWTGLVEGLAAYYQSPGRLAGLRRRFESAFRQPGLDPATFATDLGMLAIQGFGDMREQARDTMIRDKFIAGQEQCALRRQLDGFAQGTPIGEIVDSCRVWESHSDSNWVAKKGYDSEVGNQSGDSRTRERRKVGVVIEEREPEIEGWKESWKQELSGMLKKCLGPNGGTPTGGSTCRWEENDAPMVDRSPRVGMVNLEHVRIGGPNWVHGWDPVETHYSQKQRRRPGNERRFGRVGQPLGPLRIKAPLTLGGGVPSRLKKGCPLGRQTPEDDGGSSQWKVDDQEFPVLGTQKTARKVIGSADPDDTEMGRRPSGHPIPVSRVLDRGMRPAKDIRSVRKGNRDVRARGVQEPLTSPLSPLAESFNLRPTSEKQQNQ